MLRVWKRPKDLFCLTRAVRSKTRLVRRLGFRRRGRRHAGERETYVLDVAGIEGATTLMTTRPRECAREARRWRAFKSRGATRVNELEVCATANIDVQNACELGSRVVF
jgi:hypothetical protein